MHQITLLTLRCPRTAHQKKAKIQSLFGRDEVYQFGVKKSAKVVQGIDVVAKSNRFHSKEDFMMNLLQDVLAETI